MRLPQVEASLHEQAYRAKGLLAVWVLVAAVLGKRLHPQPEQQTWVWWATAGPEDFTVHEGRLLAVPCRGRRAQSQQIWQRRPPLPPPLLPLPLPLLAPRLRLRGVPLHPVAQVRAVSAHPLTVAGGLFIHCSAPLHAGCQDHLDIDKGGCRTMVAKTRPVALQCLQ